MRLGCAEDILPTGNAKGPAVVPIIEDAYTILSEVAEHCANFDFYIRETLLKSSMDTLHTAQGRWNTEYGERLTPAVNCFVGQLKDIHSLYEEIEKKLLVLHDFSAIFNILVCLFSPMVSPHLYSYINVPISR